MTRCVNRSGNRQRLSPFRNSDEGSWANPFQPLSSWLRDVCAPRHGIKTPVVMRMDIEGVEYDTLFDLAAAGIGYNMDLYVTVEWHRGAKRRRGAKGRVCVTSTLITREQKHYKRKA